MEFIVLASAHFVALLSPGPDFFLILRSGIRLPRRHGMALCCGISVGGGIWILLAILGIESLRGFDMLVRILRYVGSGYLIYLGVMLLSAKPGPDISEEEVFPQENAKVIDQFKIGFLSAFLNPKNIIFYLALFTSIVSSETPVAVRVLYGAWMTLVVLVWDSALLILVGRSRRIFQSSGWRGNLERISGLALTGFGIVLPFT